MKLSELARTCDFQMPETDLSFSGITHDSRAVQPGDLFVAIPGRTHDGLQFIESALRRGAVAVATQSPEAVPPGATFVRVVDARRFLSHAAEAFFEFPTRRLRTIGVTGTNGKTTATWLMSQALDHLEKPSARMGTIENCYPGFRETSLFTTPEGNAVSAFAARALQAQAEFLCLEVSSHALAQGRSDAIQFEVCAFTNLSQDHLDFHRDFEDYFQAKAQLFLRHKPAHSVICTDGEHGKRLCLEVESIGLRVHTVSVNGNRDSTTVALDVRANREGLKARVVHQNVEYAFSSSLIGRHNLENLLVAFGVLVELGFAPERALNALSQASGPPGRLTRVVNTLGIEVLIDYAHTPDALEKALVTAREITPGKLIVVFGCGGNRDQGKRPQMGAVAATHADIVYLTSDNPRNESPDFILDQIAEGLGARSFFRNADRRECIHQAVGAAAPGDTVIIAGKGHETYQIIGDHTLPFDDHEVAKSALDVRKRD